MPAEGDDPLGAQSARGQYAAQADRAVADHGDRGTGPHPGGQRRVVPGRHHVGQRQQRGQQPGVTGGVLGQLDQGAVGERHPDRLALAAVGAGAAPEAAVRAGGLQTLAAERADAVGPDEGRHHQVAGPEPAHLGADRLDHAQELVPDPLTGLPFGDAPVGPQVAAADAGQHGAHDGVAGLADDRVGNLLDAYVVGSLDNGGAHGISSLGTKVAAYDHPPAHVIPDRRIPIAGARHPAAHPSG